MLENIIILLAELSLSILNSFQSGVPNAIEKNNLIEENNLIKGNYFSDVNYLIKRVSITKRFIKFYY